MNIQSQCEEKDKSWWKKWVDRQKHKIISSLGNEGWKGIYWAQEWKSYRWLAADGAPSGGDSTSGCWQYVGQDGGGHIGWLTDKKNYKWLLLFFLFTLVFHFHYYTFYTPINLLPSFTVKNSCVGLMSKDACGSELASQSQPPKSRWVNTSSVSGWRSLPTPP